MGGELLLALVVVLWQTGNILFTAAFNHIAPTIPYLLRGNTTAIFAIDNYIWSHSVPSSARIQYLGSLALKVAAGAVSLVWLYDGDVSLNNLIVGSLFLVVLIVRLLRRCIRYYKFLMAPNASV